MDLNFYSDLSGSCGQNVDTEFLDTQAYGEYSENKFPGGSDNYLTITGAGHPFLSAETFHTPSLGDEVFEIPPISLDPDSALNVGDVVSHFGELSDGSDGVVGQVGSRNLVSNLVVGANDPSFASTFVNSGSQGIEHLNLGVMSQSGAGALLSSSALELGNSNGSHFSSSSPMTIDVQLGDIGHGLLGSGQLSTINQSELGLGLSAGNILLQTNSPEQPMSATASPAGSLQDDDIDDFRSVLVDCPMPLSSSSSSSSSGPSHITPRPALLAAAPVRRGGGKPATLASVTALTAAAAAAAAGKKVRKKKDPNEPVKPVSAYALFFRDTQAAIKGQNPNASFGEVSKIVASMWDSLAEEQKQVYKRKTEMAKKEYLHALAAYRANQMSQPSSEVMEPSPSPPPPAPPPAPPVVAMAPAARLAPSGPLEENTITNICASNIILDVPEVTTRSRTGANKPQPLGAVTVATASPAPPGVTKIIISRQMLQAGGQVVTVLPSGVRTLQPVATYSAAARLPPPLQQMQHAPPPPRLQQMAPAPPPLQMASKPREGGVASAMSAGGGGAAVPPPPLQIKIVPASAQGGKGGPVIVTTATATVVTAGALSTAAGGLALQVVNSAHVDGSPDEEVVAEVFSSEETDMEVGEALDGLSGHSVCVRAGCNNPTVDSSDWDQEYCSNECVADHCRDIFMAWCSIRSHNMGTVK